MRVSRIAWAPYRIPFVTPYETAHGGRSTHRAGLILRLESDTGYIGLGEANLDPSRPEQDVESISPSLEALARDVIDADPAVYDEVLEEHATGDDADRAAHCAIETALADAGGRSSGTSIATLLAHQFTGETSIVRNAVRVNATIAQQRTEAAAHAALLAVAAGFSWETEANAIATIRALEPQDLELVEQPIPPGNFDALDRVRSAVSVAIAADEAIVNYETAERAIHAADAVVLKPMRLGGASVTRYLAQFAASSGLGVVVTTNIDTGIGTAMALHVAASLLDDGRAHGLATASLLQHDLLTVPLAVDRGVIYLPSAPGLGVELDDEAVERYCGEWREVR